MADFSRLSDAIDASIAKSLQDEQTINDLTTAEASVQLQIDELTAKLSPEPPAPAATDPAVTPTIPA